MTSCECGTIPFSSLDIVSLLLEGALVLFPYDASANHTPGLFSGVKAHWLYPKDSL